MCMFTMNEEMGNAKEIFTLNDNMLYSLYSLRITSSRFFSASLFGYLAKDESQNFLLLVFKSFAD